MDLTELGQIVRHHRKELGLTQAQAAALCNVGTRFMSDLENGKVTMQMAKVLQVLHGLGLEIVIQKRRLGDA